MSANISEIMHEIESYGMPKDRVRDVVAKLLFAGKKSFLASVGELAGQHELSVTEFELTVANVVALSNRTDVLAAASRAETKS